MTLEELKEKARKVRLDVLRMNGLKNRGHIGGTFSCVELLVSLYHGGHLKDKDFFYLSKGHACAAVYSILHDLGKMSKETLDTYGQDGGLGGQLNVATSGVDWNTGSIGHALGVAAGVALASKLDGVDKKAWCMIGDAELAEGSIWEALIFAGNHNLKNLICIIDRNKLSATDSVQNDKMFNNLGETVQNMGWESVMFNGHDFERIHDVFTSTRKFISPTLLIAQTIKGKGVSFMENNVKWHYGVPNEQEYQQALEELSHGFT